MSTESRLCSTAEFLAAEMLASGWPKKAIDGLLGNVPGHELRQDVIDSLNQELSMELFSKLTLYRVVANLDEIRALSLAAGSYDAAASAAARIADLLTLIPKT